ncbi:MAG: hypothetical protein IT342_24705 [Candidatus Melainabacteria bacterium]|nr:hypothetical protein [Candidatus Melainabacteria bacterium]
MTFENFGRLDVQKETSITGEGIAYCAWSSMAKERQTGGMEHQLSGQAFIDFSAHHLAFESQSSFTGPNGGTLDRSSNVSVNQDGYSRHTDLSITRPDGRTLNRSVTVSRSSSAPEQET